MELQRDVRVQPVQRAAKKKNEYWPHLFIYYLICIETCVPSPPDRRSQFQFFRKSIEGEARRTRTSEAPHFCDTYAFDRSRRSIVVISANRSVRKTWSTLFNSRQRRSRPKPGRDSTIRNKCPPCETHTDTAAFCRFHCAFSIRAAMVFDFTPSFFSFLWYLFICSLSSINTWKLH